MRYDEYEKLYEELQQQGFMQRLADIGETQCEVTPELWQIWSEFIDCHSVEHCSADGVLFLGGVPYCLTHATRILESLEEHKSARSRVEQAKAAVQSAYDALDDAAFEKSWAELQAAESALSRLKGSK